MSKNVPFKKRGYSPINLDHETELLDTSDEEFDPPQPSPVLFHNENSKYFLFNLIFYRFSALICIGNGFILL